MISARRTTLAQGMQSIQSIRFCIFSFDRFVSGDAHRTLALLLHIVTFRSRGFLKSKQHLYNELFSLAIGQTHLRASDSTRILLFCCCLSALCRDPSLPRLKALRQTIRPAVSFQSSILLGVIVFSRVFVLFQRGRALRCFSCVAEDVFTLVS